jgi:hypothetical protein
VRKGKSATNPIAAAKKTDEPTEDDAAGADVDDSDGDSEVKPAGTSSSGAKKRTSRKD